MTKHVAEQRAYTDELNRGLQAKLTQRGMIFNAADVATFRRKLGDGFYQRWKAQLGAEAWTTLEEYAGKLA